MTRCKWMRTWLTTAADDYKDKSDCVLVCVYVEVFYHILCIIKIEKKQIGRERSCQ